jgi:co-chaperonin GroES (HSP10)
MITDDIASVDKVLGKVLLVKVLPKKEKVTEGGILLPEVAQNEPDEFGEVVKVSEHTRGVEVGDTVHYSASAGRAFNYNGFDHKYINGPTESTDGDIWSVVKLK